MEDGVVIGDGAGEVVGGVGDGGEVRELMEGKVVILADGVRFAMTGGGHIPKGDRLVQIGWGSVGRSAECLPLKALREEQYGSIMLRGPDSLKDEIK